ncbi:restriction endonuclease subunit S [Helicobacter pylori]|uniref:restriction endonuclease subunit S n=1 Tax=Helicobacter pylori TaxID=210 RepID=UPI000991D6AA|nr:restriction endonuclease subunit S [Helicobacter pylori]OOP89463.1 restriction endonuclease [Helicobacter pylori]PDW91807.1 restriction endonuclease [Helicobacter pylori]
MDTLTTPLNWQRVGLGDIGKPCMCKRVMKHQTTRYGEIPFYKIGTFGNTADAFISKKLFLEYKTKYSFPKKGDILISASGTIGRAVIYDGKPAYFQDSNIVWIDNDETLVKNDFLFYVYSHVKWNTEHTTILRLYNDNFRNTLIPLPPLNEQIAIANILSGLDHYLYSLGALILKKESVKKALSFELLSQRKRLKGFNQAWQKVRLGTYKYRRGSFPQPYGNPQWYSDNGMPFVQVYDVGENFKLTQKTKQKISKIAQPMSVFVPKNSVIITLQGTIGRVALTQYGCYCDRTILIFDNNTLNDVNKYFFVLSLFTKFEEEKRKADGSIIKTITKQTLKDFEILLPPLNEQIAIANILSALDNEIISLKNKKRQFENIKKALNHDLMSAKIRVLK